MEYKGDFGCNVRLLFLLPFLWRYRTDLDKYRERLDCGRDDVIARMAWCGPVAHHLFRGKPPTMQQVTTNIADALSGNPFTLEAAQPNFTGTQPVHHVFLIAPITVEENGERRLSRREFFAEFLTPNIASKTFELAEIRMEHLQPYLSRAFDISSTRGIAGKLVEGLMHRSLLRGIQLPAVLGGGGAVAATLELLGKADSFCMRSTPTTKRPLYLRPLLPTFAAVDAMVSISSQKLVLLQTSLGGVHSKDYGAMLGCIARLPNGAGVEVTTLDEVVYCLVGSTAHRVQGLVRAAKATLAQLQDLAKNNHQKFGEEVGFPTKIARTRILMFRVVGLTFDHRTGFTQVNA